MLRSRFWLQNQNFGVSVAAIGMVFEIYLFRPVWGSPDGGAVGPDKGAQTNSSRSKASGSQLISRPHMIINSCFGGLCLRARRDLSVGWSAVARYVADGFRMSSFVGKFPQQLVQFGSSISFLKDRYVFFQTRNP